MKNKYPEFEKLTIIEDKSNPFCVLFEYDTGDRFYIEPLFYMYLQNFKVQYPKEVDRVLLEMENIVLKNHRVIFTGMDEEFEEDPVTKADGYIILTLFDITDKLGIYIENKSRGSDYGD